MNKFKEIKDKMIGRIAMMEEEAEFLTQYTSSLRFHIEIGCLWGGSTCLVALSNPYIRVVTIDAMKGGYWETGDPSNGMIPTPGAVLDNLAAFGVADRVSVVKQSSDPWPLSHIIVPDSVMIDGDHSYEGCVRDWNNVTKLEPNYIFIHDVGTGKHPGVQKAMEKHILSDDNYSFVRTVGTLSLMVWRSYLR